VRRGVKGNESLLKTGCHVEAVSSLGRAALHVLPCEAVHQPIASWINQEAKVAQKVHPEDGELDHGQEKRPVENPAVEGQLKLFVPPARYRLTGCPSQGRTMGRAG
jgi:hypothetical protein